MKNYGIDVIDDFLIEKSINEGLSNATIKTYVWVFNTMLSSKFILIDNFDTYTEMNFKRFLADCVLKYKWSSKTYNNCKMNLKVFCDYLVSLGYLQVNPILNIKNRKLEKKLPKFLTTRQINELKNTIEDIYGLCDFNSVRNNIIIYTYLYTGLRLQELTNLKFRDIDFLNFTIRVNSGKGNKDRIIPLVYELSDKLIPYLLLKKRCNINNEYVFCSRFSLPLRHKDIYNIFIKISGKLNFKLRPHMLRHTFATECMRKNQNLDSLANILGHSKVETTRIYCGIDMKSITNNLNQANLYK